MKLSKGMYVRTEYGIAKIINISDEYLECNNTIMKSFEESFCSWSISELNIVKANYKLEELVEPMDLMYIDVDPNDGYGGITVPRVAETLNELKKWKQRFASGECILKGVLTKEQIVSNWYLDE